MQQGTEGTERFCIKQLLKPIDNVGCHSVLCMEPLSGDQLQIVAISPAVVFLAAGKLRQAILLAASWHHVFVFSSYVYRFCVGKTGRGICVHW